MSEPKVREHIADGIEEYDNPLPRWWVYLFYFTIVFAIGYSVMYPSFWFWGGTQNWTQANQYANEMAYARERFPAASGQVDLEQLSQDPATVSEGHDVFAANCIVCHGENAEGKIGPSLVDAEWKYGSDSSSIIKTIRNGRPGGMPPHKRILSKEQIVKVGAFVYSLRRGNTVSTADR